MKNRVGIAVPFHQLAIAPSIFNAVEMLAEAGYHVDVYVRDPNLNSRGLRPAEFEHQRVDVINIPGPRDRRQGSVRFIPGRLFWPLYVAKRHLQKKYCCFIGVDPGGLVRADRLTRLIKVPLVYYSLEVYVADENIISKSLKAEEVKLSQKALFTIIQDGERAGVLAKHNHIPDGKFAFVPNAPAGPAVHRPSRYWHRRFGLPPETRVVLHIGGIRWWTHVSDIVQSVTDWPDDWVLVVHTNIDYNVAADSVLSDLKALAPPGRVCFSEIPVRRQELPNLLNGADIGIAFYPQKSRSPDKPLPLNARRMGLSSGKISSYLSAGLPVIVNRIESVVMSKLLTKYRCGIVVENSSQIRSAILRIEDDYQDYSQGSIELFNNHLDFRKAFQQVLTRLGQIET